MGGFCSSTCSFFFGCFGHQTHDPKGTTLVKDRSCTDKLIFLLYIAAWVGSVVVISRAASLGGNPAKIINGVDMNGNICGYTSIVKDSPYAALVNPITLDTDSLDVWTCVSNCNQTRDPNNVHFSKNYASTEFYGYCIPTFDVSVDGSVDIQVKSQFDSNFDSANQVMTHGISDLANSWQVILMSVFFALFFAYVYMYLLKKWAGIIIWLCILLVIIGGFFLGYTFLKLANESNYTYTSERRIQAYRVAGYVFISATSLFVLVILALSSQITLAIEVVKEGSRAINDMKLIIFTPLLPMIMVCLYFLYFIYGALYIFSVSDLVEKETPEVDAYYQDPHPKAGQHNGNSDTYKSFEINNQYRPLAAYWLFHMFWSVQFCVYFGYFVIAGAVCSWYFTLSDANGNKMIGGEFGGSRVPIMSSLYRTIRYHLGTIAFASLIIAIVQMIRVTIKYIEAKTRSTPPNYLQKAVFCLIQCCLKCIECCLDKINKNALVWTAMWGDPFLSASCSSFALIWRNLGRVAAIHMVSNVILLIGKLCIVVVTVGLSAIILGNVSPWRETVSSAFVPCFLIAIISYFVSWIFFLTFETVIDTTFLCFLVDSENAEKHAGEAMFASKGLQSLIGKYELRSAMSAETEKKEAAMMYKNVGGAKVQQDHQQAVAHLNRAVSVVRAEEEQHASTEMPTRADGHRHGWTENNK